MDGSDRIRVVPQSGYIFSPTVATFRGYVCKGCRVANVCGEGTSRDLAALRVIRGLNALRGGVETLGESHVSVEPAHEAR